ncbi:MAG: hypothetical protein Q8L41_04820 [Anaerolineales bacterium]|nr:hypothetical protein [Anaerolineales bacterium]
MSCLIHSRTRLGLGRQDAERINHIFQGKNLTYIVTFPQKACSPREGTKTTKIFKGKFKNLKNIPKFFSFRFAVNKIPSRP